MHAISCKRRLLAGALLAGILPLELAQSSAVAAGPAVQQRHAVVCAGTTVTEDQMRHIVKVVSVRIEKTFGFRKASVAVNENCVDVSLPHTITWLRWLATDVSGRGSFSIAQSVPDPKAALSVGTRVRFPRDPQSSAPEVKVIVARPGIKRWTAKLVTEDSGTYVQLKLKSSGSRRFCDFTKSNQDAYAAIILDGRVVSDPQITQSICGGSLLVGFPAQKSLDRPLGPRQVVAELRSGLLPRPGLTIQSLR